MGTPGPAEYGVAHSSELPFVFNNPQNGLSVLLGPKKSYHDVANILSRMWISFTTQLDPNKHGVKGVPSWPVYGDGAENFVFHADTTGGGYIEADTYRQEGMQFLIDTQAERSQ